jgi:hypothetical protein
MPGRPGLWVHTDAAADDRPRGPNRTDTRFGGDHGWHAVIESDVALLRRLATISTSSGEVVRLMLSHAEDGRLRAGDLRSVGRELEQLGSDMQRRADELDRKRVIDSDDTQ